jgi:hypothetical protein
MDTDKQGGASVLTQSSPSKNSELQLLVALPQGKSSGVGLSCAEGST